MPIEILKNGAVIRSIPHVLTASLCDKLDGTLTFDFTALQKGKPPILPGMTAEYDGQVYSIVRVKRGFSAGLEISTVSCEHISYTLNEEQYNLVTFVFEGMPKDGLAELLAGTPFSVGIVEPSVMVECAFTDQSPLNRRSALMRFADACGGELEYDGYAINIRTHRGSTVRKELMDGTNVTSLSATFDSRKDTQAYEIQLFKRVNLSVGDEVRIRYRPLSIDVDTRIVGLTCNPFDRYSVRVEVGDYVPNLLAAETERLEGIRQEFRAANGRLESVIESVEGGLSELTQTVSGFDFRIQSAEKSVMEMSLTVNGFDTRIVNAEGMAAEASMTVGGFDARIKNAEGLASEASLKVGSFDTRITSAEGSVSALSQTVNGFETRIANAEGSVSSLSQTVNGISTKVTNMEGNVSKVEQTADKINWLVKSGTSASNFTLTDRAISLVSSKIDLTGFVTFNNLKTSGQTTINAGNITTGTIDASKVTVTNLQINNVKYGTYPVITCTGTYSNPNIAVGKDQLSNSVSPTKLSIYGTTINVGDETSTLYTVNVKGGYVKLICGSYINIGTTSYYAVMNSNREFRPNTQETSYPFYLGTSSYPWHNSFITNLNVVTSAKLGTSTSAKIGFFGTTPVARKSVASSATVATLITALKGYGLIY